jgi:RND family efflux transporter MFP subunit
MRKGRGPGLVFGVVALLALLALVAAGVLPRLQRERALDARAAQMHGPPRVAVAAARLGAPQSELVLPGTALPAQNTVIHARLDGFVGKLAADLGDQVREGQLLAVLQAPEIEAELARAKARLVEVERNLTLSHASAERHARLASGGISSQEAADEARARANSAEAGLDAGRAEVGRLAALYAYHRVLAPFDGVITRREVDRGALVKGGTTALFEIAQIKTLKVFVEVPQSLAGEVRVGMPAEVFAPEAPAKLASGKVVRTSGALDPATRTLRAEVHLPGADKGGPLLAGAFVRVRLKVQRATPPVLVPTSAVAMRKEGPRVVVLLADRRVQQRKVVPGRDLGAEIELLEGLQGGERVVLSPGDDLQDGAVVTVAEGAGGK